MRRAVVILKIALIAACADGTEGVALPRLDTYRTLVLAPRDGSAMRVIPLPAASIRVDVESELADGGYADLLLFSASPDELGIAPGEARATADPVDPPFPLPDRAYVLDERLGWQDADPTPWAKLRLPLAPCLSLASHEVELGADSGDVVQLVPRAPAEVLAVTGRGELYSVSSAGDATKVPRVIPAPAQSWRATADEVGHVWVSYSSTFAATASTAKYYGFGVVELDEELNVERRVRLPAGSLEEGERIQELVGGRVGGHMELFILSSAIVEGPPPRLYRWREGEEQITRLPWPRSEDELSPCFGSGIYRSAMIWRGPDKVSFFFRTPFIVRWDGGALSRDRLTADACGGTLLDENPAKGLALVASEAPGTTGAFYLYRREELAWSAASTEGVILNGYALTSWWGRPWASADLGDIIELTPDRRGGFRACPAIEVSPLTKRVFALTDAGELLAVAGEQRHSAKSVVAWVERAP